jgi:hypothetical protein
LAVALRAAGVATAMHNMESDRETEQNEIPELEVLYAYRDAKARLRALHDLLGEVYIREEEIDNIAFEAMTAMASNQLQKVAWCTRSFIFSERLFPSGLDARQSRSDIGNQRPNFKASGAWRVNQLRIQMAFNWLFLRISSLSVRRGLIPTLTNTSLSLRVPFKFVEAAF